MTIKAIRSLEELKGLQKGEKVQINMGLENKKVAAYGGMNVEKLPREPPQNVYSFFSLIEEETIEVASATSLDLKFNETGEISFPFSSTMYLSPGNPSYQKYFSLINGGQN